MTDTLPVVSSQDVLRRICGEYLEMPGLLLTPAQARRLWALDDTTCARLLDYLVETRFLCRQRDGKYGRSTDGAVTPPFHVSPPFQMAKAQLAPRAKISAA
jgi:hypothetical protein